MYKINSKFGLYKLSYDEYKTYIFINLLISQFLDKKYQISQIWNIVITHYDQDEEEENDESGSEDRKDRFDEEKVFKEIKKGLESGYIMCGKALGKLTFKLIFYV